MLAKSKILVAVALVAIPVMVAGPTAGYAAGGPGTKSGTPQFMLPDATFVATVAGVTVAKLQSDLAAGKTVLQIAGTRYPSAGALATALLAPFRHKIDAAVSSGKMPSQKVETAYSLMHAAYVRLVTTPHPPLSSSTPQTKKAGGGGSNADAVVFTVLAAKCKTTSAALQAAFAEGGKTPLAICQATNASITEDVLVVALVDALAQQMDHTPSSDERANMTTKITLWVTTPLGPSNGPPKR